VIPMKLNNKELQDIITRDLGKTYRVSSSRRIKRVPSADAVTPEVRAPERRARAALPETDALEDDDLTVVEVRQERDVADSRGKTLSVVVSTKTRKVIGEQG
jgi:hypothetical protein